MSKPLDLAEIRARLERTGYSPWKDDTFALLAEVERLRAEVDMYTDAWATDRAEKESLAATVERLRAEARP